MAVIRRVIKRCGLVSATGLVAETRVIRVSEKETKALTDSLLLHLARASCHIPFGDIPPII